MSRLRCARLLGAAFAAALLLSACGGGSGSSSTSQTSTASTAGAQAAKAGGGYFTTVIPAGFSDATASLSTSVFRVLYDAAAAPVNGFSTNINVVREQAPSGDIASDTVRELTTLKRAEPGAYGFSTVSSMTVDGSPAREVDYLSRIGGHLLHLRQVFVLHAGAMYTITYERFRHGMPPRSAG